MPPRKKASQTKKVQKVEEKSKVEEVEEKNISDVESDEAEKPVKKAKAGKKKKVEETVTSSKPGPKSSKISKAKESDDEDEEDEKPPAKKARQGRTKEAAKEEEEKEEPKQKEAKQPMNKTTSNLEEIDFGCEKLNEDGEKYNLKICCWNVSGIRALIKKQGIEYLKKEDADIIALQEIKCDSIKLPNEVKLPGYERYFLDSKRSGYCGVALYSKVKPIEVKYGIKNSECNDEGRIITAEFEKFYLVNVYVPNSGQKLVTMPKRMQWNEDFKSYVKQLDAKKPVVITGDLNVAHQEIDLTNPKTNTKNAGFTKEERDAMTNFLAEGFVDTFRKFYPEKTGAYTFWAYFNNARARNIGWRLDYFLVSQRISKKVCDTVIRDKVYGSDHCPIILYANC